MSAPAPQAAAERTVLSASQALALYVGNARQWLFQNLPQAIKISIIGFVSGYVVNFLLMAFVFDGYRADGGSLTTAQGNLANGMLAWSIFFGVASGLYTYRKRVGKERFAAEMKAYPANITALFRDDGAMVWTHVLWGAAVSLLASTLILRWAGLAVGMLIVTVALSPLGRILAALITQLWRQAMSQMMPHRQLRATGSTGLFVGLFTSSLVMGVGFFLPGQLIKLLLGVVCLVVAIVLAVRRPGPGTTALLLVALGTAAWMIAPGTVWADDGGFKEANSNWKTWVTGGGMTGLVGYSTFGGVAGGGGSTLGWLVGTGLSGPTPPGWSNGGVGDDPHGGGGPGGQSQPQTQTPTDTQSPPTAPPPSPPGAVPYTEDHQKRLTDLLGRQEADPDQYAAVNKLVEDIKKNGSIDEDRLRQLEANQDALDRRRWGEIDAANADMEINRQVQLAKERADADREVAEARRKEAEQKFAREELDRVRQAAEHTGQTDTDQRAWDLDKVYKPDGSLDLDYIERLKGATRKEIVRDMVAPAEALGRTGTLDWMTDAATKTVDDAAHSFIVRVGTGVLTGGASEIAFQSYTGVEKLRDAVNKATDQGKDFTMGDAAKTWAEHMAEENLPVNTVKVLGRMREQQMRGQKTDVTWKEIGFSVVGDLFATHGVMEAGGRLSTLGERFTSGPKPGAPKGDFLERALNNAVDGTRGALDRAGNVLGFELPPAKRLDPGAAGAKFESGQLTASTKEIISDVKESGATAKADEAFARGRERGKTKVDTFEQAVRELDEAKAAGHPPEVTDPLKRKVMDATIEVQGDKHAMNELGKLPKEQGQNATIRRFNENMNQVYKDTDKATIERLAKEYGVKPEDIAPVVITNTKGKPDPTIGTIPEGRDHFGLASTPTLDGSVQNPRGVHGEGPMTPPPPPKTRAYTDPALDPKAAPGPPGKPDKVSMDRDLTMRVRSVENGVEVWRDIPASTTGKIYNEELYKQMMGKDPGPRGTKPGHSVDFKDTHLDPHETIGDATALTDPDKFAKRMDQATTDRMHPEAYGAGKPDLDTATKDTHRGRDLRDAGATARTMEFKEHHWSNEAEHLNTTAEKLENGAQSSRDAAAASDHAPTAETHQELAESQQSRADKMREQGQSTTEEGQRQLVKQYNNMVVTRTQAMIDMGNAPGASIPHDLAEKINVLQAVQRGDLTPAQAEATLNRMGTSTSQVGHQMGAYVEAMQNVRPTHPPPPPSPSVFLASGGVADAKRL